ncbi:hypothetical protein CTAM01_15621 [Colletotrichum tamarilloi]|uniref:Uncharacterized protein n=1 Tax=Colletotrichum tamarilloi TaxID=1209934 RepID=A0ABQ9QKU2_9PEZI|nr:uncharacterized protein CTAM01_15621 [Colletotrichum tamarilloi]KAK1475804.1 hypothetical protein CTAM01_15621 [Colletotrichum tamarilloi]
MYSVLRPVQQPRGLTLPHDRWLTSVNQLMATRVLSHFLETFLRIRLTAFNRPSQASPKQRTIKPAQRQCHARRARHRPGSSTEAQPTNQSQLGSTGSLVTSKLRRCTALSAFLRHSSPTSTNPQPSSPSQPTRAHPPSPHIPHNAACDNA